MTNHDEAMARAAEHHRAGRLSEAEQIYRQVLAANPRHAPALHLLGLIAKKVRRFDDASALIQQAIAIDPRQAAFHANLGEVYRAWAKLPEAEACYREALRLQPALAAAFNNLGLALQTQGRVAEATAHFDEAIRLEPNYADAHVNRSRVYLLEGEFERAWREYSGPPNLQNPELRALNVPAWDGSPVEDGTLLLHAEQGLGDALHFIRYLPWVEKRVSDVVVQLAPAIIPLLAQSGFQHLVPQGEPLAGKAFAAQTSLASLPAVFGTTLDTIPTDVPYLRADAALVAEWRKRLAGISGRKIGIAWQGNPAFYSDPFRSIPLAEFAPLAAVPGVRLISLQKNFGAEQVAALGGHFEVLTLLDDVDRGPAAFLDTAAIMKNLDLVITSDTSIAHLAGALGVPVWVALPIGPDWRWLTEREDSPWYPTMRLWRQSRLGAWSDVFQRMAVALARGDT